MPEVQPGSSIMPGKVNPVIAESVAMVAAQVMGNDATITIAGQSGNFELNVMLPLIAYNLLQSIELLANAAENLTDQCVVGIQATERGPELVEKGLMLATALAPGSATTVRPRSPGGLQDRPHHPRGSPRKDRSLRRRARQPPRRSQDARRPKREHSQPRADRCAATWSSV